MALCGCPPARLEHHLERELGLWSAGEGLPRNAPASCFPPQASPHGAFAGQELALLPFTGPAVLPGISF